jgi:hypothetical protein
VPPRRGLAQYPHETRDLLAQRDRELAEGRRSRGSMPAKLRG